MSESWQNVCVTMAGTFVTSLSVAAVLPSQMTPTSWMDLLWTAGLQAVVMGLGAIGFHTPVVQRTLGRQP
jgi:hypothetical protein